MTKNWAQTDDYREVDSPALVATSGFVETCWPWGFRQKGRMDFLFDAAQEGRIHVTGKAAEKAAEKATEALAGNADLKRRVEVLALANQALFEILQARLGISEEEVVLRMAEIDARDGRKDGKISPRVVACRKCGRKVSTARQRCLFCGAVIKDGHVFEKS